MFSLSNRKGGEKSNMSRLYDVTREEVDASWKAVRQAGGGCGHDGKSIKDVEADLDNQLYKIWNRMSSGSYMAQPVLLVNIPKAKGGFRQLGIPTVTDRIAQHVIKRRLEAIVEPLFHDDSYAYRPNRSAIDALAVVRERCFRHEWLLEIDIKAFFDTLNHDKLMEIVDSYTDDKSIRLYVRKFLKAPGRMENGEEVERTTGTPQGGVVSPVLANLYLHEAFDSWMAKAFPAVKVCRYADDIVLHCVSEKQAYFMRNRIGARLKEYDLELHPEKTRIVYTGTSNDSDHRGHGLSRKFTFLGYDFKPRMGKDGRLVYSPGIGSGALKLIRVKIRSWNWKRRLPRSVEDIAKEADRAIRGWINYYGHYRRSELYRLMHMIDTYLTSFIKRKHRKGWTWAQAWRELRKLKREKPRLFSHWYMIKSAG